MSDEKVEVTQYVSNRISNLKKYQGLALPKGYSVGNALQTAWLEITDDSHGTPLNKICTPKSIVKALTDMVIQGLSSAKNQCYFIPYGKKLTMQRSYFGTSSVVKRLSNVKDIKAHALFEGDEFEIGSDDEFNEVVTKYIPKFKNRDNPIIGAFAIIFKNDGTKDYTIMTKKEIDTSWGQAKSKRSGARANFQQEMAKRTVLNRAAKFYINSANDNEMLLQSINDTTADEYENDDRKDVTPEDENVSIKDLGTKPDKDEENDNQTEYKSSEDDEKPSNNDDENNSNQENKDDHKKETKEEFLEKIGANDKEGESNDSQEDGIKSE